VEITMPNMYLDFSATALAQVIETNILDYSAHFSHLPDAEMYNTPVMRWFATGIPDAGLNGVLQAQLAPDTCDTQSCALLLAHRPFVATGIFGRTVASAWIDAE
jgi:hypothetical protein